MILQVDDQDVSARWHDVPLLDLAVATRTIAMNLPDSRIEQLCRDWERWAAIADKSGDGWKEFHPSPGANGSCGGGHGQARRQRPGSPEHRVEMGHI